MATTATMAEGKSTAAGAGRTPVRRRGRATWVIIAALLALNAAGGVYYVLPLAERVRHPLHAWLKPSGHIGQSAGLAALALLLFIWLYPLRKKLRWLAFTGSVGRWLDLHILAGLAMPLLVTVHAGWRFDGLIGLGCAALFIVCLSGIVGKYLYLRIPRSRSGLELSLEQIEQRKQGLLGEICAATGIIPAQIEKDLREAVPTSADGGLARALLDFLFNDIHRWRATRALKRRWSTRSRRLPDGRALSRAVRMARREIALSQQVRMLDATHRLFHYWHVAHRPVAITALVAVLLHVGFVISLGVTWF